MKRPAIVALLALTGLLTATQWAGAATPRTVTVSGTGIVTTVPNQASFSFGVSTTGKTAQDALSANAALMTRVVAALRRSGITAANLQTAEISLSPNTNQNGTSIIDFSASNSVTAVTDDVARSGAIVDGAVGAGANLVSGPTLTPSDELVLSRRALAAAIADARARAAAIAAAAGVKLGAVLSVSEASATPPVLSGLAARAASPSTPVEAGTVQTEEDVTVVYAIT